MKLAYANISLLQGPAISTGQADVKRYNRYSYYSLQWSTEIDGFNDGLEDFVCDADDSQQQLFPIRMYNCL